MYSNVPAARFLRKQFLVLESDLNFSIDKWPHHVDKLYLQPNLNYSWNHTDNGPLTSNGNGVTTYANAYINKFSTHPFLCVSFSILAVCLYSATGLKNNFAESNLTIMQSIAYPQNTILSDDVIDEYLNLIKQTSRSKYQLQSRLNYHVSFHLVWGCLVKQKVETLDKKSSNVSMKNGR